MNPRPPCWPGDRVQPNPCALVHYARVIEGHTDLTADWLGWKQRGRWLASPASDRLWRLQQEERLTATRNRNASRKAVRQQM